MGPVALAHDQESHMERDAHCTLLWDYEERKQADVALGLLHAVTRSQVAEPHAVYGLRSQKSIR